MSREIRRLPRLINFRPARIFVLISLLFSFQETARAQGNGSPVCILASPECETLGNLLEHEWKGNRKFQIVAREPLSITSENKVLSLPPLPAGAAKPEFILLLEEAVEEENTFLVARFLRFTDRHIAWTHVTNRGADSKRLVGELQTKIESMLPIAIRNSKSKSTTILIHEIRSNTASVSNPASAILEKFARSDQFRPLVRRDSASSIFGDRIAQIESPELAAPEIEVTGEIERLSESINYTIRIENRTSGDSKERFGELQFGSTKDLLDKIASDIVSTVPGETEAAESAPAPYTPRFSTWNLQREAEHYLNIGLHGIAAEKLNTEKYLESSLEPDLELLRLFATYISQLSSLSHVPVLSDKLHWMLTPSLAFGEEPLRLRHHLNYDSPADLIREAGEVALILKEAAKTFDPASIDSYSRTQKTKYVQFDQLFGFLGNEIAKEILQDPARRPSPAEVETCRGLLAAVSEYRGFHGNSASAFSSGSDLINALLMADSAAEAGDILFETLYVRPYRRISKANKDTWLYTESALKRERLAIFHCLSIKGYNDDVDFFQYHSIEEDLIEKDWVARSSTSPQTLEKTFEKVLKRASGSNPELAKLDRLYRELVEAQELESRAMKFQELADDLSAIPSESPDHKMLGVYAGLVTSFTKWREFPGSFDDPEKDALEVYSAIHAAASKSVPWGCPGCSLDLIDALRQEEWKNVASKKELDAVLHSISSDIEAISELAKSTRSRLLANLKRSRLDLGLDPVAKVMPSPGTLVRPTETRGTIPLNVYAVAPRYPNFLGMSFDRTRLYQLHHGLEKPHRVTQIMVFNTEGRWKEEDPITLPEEVHRCLDENGRQTAMKVTDRKILIGYRGGIAEYDRQTGEWTVREDETLTPMRSFAFVGNHLVAHNFFPQSKFSQEDESVMRLYVTEIDLSGRFSPIDTTRRPPQNPFDSQLLHAPIFRKMVPQGSSEFLTTIGTSGRQQQIFRVVINPDTKSADFVSSNIGLGVKSEPTWNFFQGARNGIVSEWGYKPGGTSREFRFRNYAAFSIQKNKPITWLLFTGEKEKQTAATFPDDIKPLYHLPHEHCWYDEEFRGGMERIYYDGTRFMLLARQGTGEFRRVLYHWENPDQKEPDVVELECFAFDKLNFSREGELDEWKAAATAVIDEIYSINGYLLFEISHGVVGIPWRSFDKRIAEIREGKLEL